MRVLAGKHRRACVDTPDLPVDVAVVRRPSIGGRVAGGAGGPSLAPMVVGECASSVFRMERLSFRPAAYRALAGGVLDFQALEGHGNVNFGDEVRRGLGVVVVENVRRQPCGQKPLGVGAVVGVVVRFAENHRHSEGGVCARHVVVEVEVKKLDGQRAAVKGYFCGEGADCKNIEWPRPVEQSFTLRTLASVSALDPCRMVAAVL